MSIEGNSHIAKTSERKAFIESQRPQQQADSADIEESKKNIQSLRDQLLGEEASAGSTTGKPGYRDGKFTMRAFLDDQKIGRIGFEEYSDGDIQQMYSKESKKGFIDLDEQSQKIEKLGELHDQRLELELQLESAPADGKAGIQSQIDDLNSQIQDILLS